MPPSLLVALLDERQEYHRLQARDAAEAAARVGVTLDVAFAENNAVLQIHQIFSRIHAAEDERPRVIVIQSVTGEGLERVARNAVAASIGWIVLNRRVAYLDDLRQSRPDLPIAVVTPDQVEIGRIHGRQARALAPDGGLLLYLQGPADTSAAQDRMRGTEQELAGSAFRWKVLNGDWNEASGETAVAGWLRLKTSGGQRPALLIAQNDAMAVGARRALARQPDWLGIPCVGCDGLPEGGQRLVASGELAATVVMPPTAGRAVELAAAWLLRHEQPPPEVVLVPRGFPPEDRLVRPDRRAH